MITTRVIGDGVAVERLNRIGSQLRVELRAAINDIGDGLRSGASGLAPYRYGKLKSTMRCRVLETPTKFKTEVYPGVGYGFVLARGVNREVRNPWAFRQTRIHGGQVVGVKTIKTKSGTVMVKPKIRRKRWEQISGRKSTKHLRIKANPYLDNALRGQQGAITLRINSAIDRAEEA